MRKIIIVVLAGLALTLAGCAVPVPSTDTTGITDVTTDVTSNNDGIDTSTTVDVIVENITDVMSEEGITIYEFCTYVQEFPETSWESFDSGSSGYFTEDEFWSAVYEVCP